MAGWLLLCERSRAGLARRLLASLGPLPEALKEVKRLLTAAAAAAVVRSAELALRLQLHRSALLQLQVTAAALNSGY
jgi:hypothetical protein